MNILVPIDGSDVSFRALTFAAGMARAYEGALHVVHVTDVQTDATGEIVDRAKEVLAAEDVDDDPEVAVDIDLDFRPSDRIGEDIVELVERDEYDHVVMGHHGSGAIERAILGSAAKTVLDAQKVPVTIVP